MFEKSYGKKCFGQEVLFVDDWWLTHRNSEKIHRKSRGKVR